MRPFSLPSTAPPAPGNSGAPRERTNPNHRSIQWPSIDGWLPVAYEALRVAHAAHCGAMALKGRSLHLDASRFLTRRAETLAHLIDALAIESRCEDNLREMDEAEVLTGLAEAEEQLSTKIRNLLATRGLKLQVVKLLEQECIFSQAIRAQIKLAQMELNSAEAEPAAVA